MIAYSSMTFGEVSISRDFDASRVENLTRGLANFYKGRVMKTPSAMFRLWRSGGVYARTLTDYDVMLSPVAGHTTPKLGHLSPEVDFETLFARLRACATSRASRRSTMPPAAPPCRCPKE